MGTKNKKLIKAVFSLAVLTFAVIGFGQFAHAQNSTVRTILCDTAGPDVQILVPDSDSTTNTSSTELSGSTVRTSQIEIYVNDAYSQSIAIGSDGLFSTTIALSQGTNTIRVEAYFACNQTNETFSVVVTYEPEVIPSPGGSTETSVPGGGQIPPTISNPDFSGQSPFAEEDPSLVDRITGNIRFIWGAKGEDMASRHTPINPVISFAMIVTLLLGLMMLVMPGYILATAFGLMSRNVYIAHRRHHVLARLFGVLFVCIAVLVLQL